MSPWTPPTSPQTMCGSPPHLTECRMLSRCLQWTKPASAPTSITSCWDTRSMNRSSSILCQNGSPLLAASPSTTPKWQLSRQSSASHSASFRWEKGRGSAGRVWLIVVVIVCLLIHPGGHSANVLVMYTQAMLMLHSVAANKPTLIVAKFHRSLTQLCTCTYTFILSSTR